VNRKGDLFMLGLDILFLVGIIFLFWKLAVEFEPKNPMEGIGTRQVALLSTYGTAEEMLLNLDVAARFSAYEAIYQLMHAGGVNSVDATCGTYASYQRWSNPSDPEHPCFPTKKTIDDAFLKHVAQGIPALMRVPGYPGSIVYTLALERKDGAIAIVGTSQDRIQLPIVAVKSGLQRTAPRVLEQGGGAQLRSSQAQDTELASFFAASPNGAPRQQQISMIVIHGSDQALQQAAEQYTKGSSSVHYAIDPSGKIVQFLPEAQAARHLPQCAQDPSPCADKDAQEKSVAIAVLGAADPSAATPEQVRALGSLVRERAGKYGITASGIVLSDQVAGKQISDAQKAWLGSLLVETTKAQGAQQDLEPTAQQPLAEQPKEKAPVATDLTVQWPTVSRVVTSCWGYRNLNGVPNDGKNRDGKEDYHDGIDMRKKGDPVFAFADGTVESVSRGCREGAKSCGGGFGNNVLIRHTDKILSRYSHMASVEGGIAKGVPVKRGQQIGIIGNTGSSSAAHLDFKVYMDGDAGPEKGSNALCLFPDSELSQLTFTGSGCEFGKGQLTRANPQLIDECKGIDARQSAGTCEFAFTAPTGGNDKVTATRKHLEEQGVLDDVVEGANQEGIEPPLALAIITQETCTSLERCGTANQVSNTGAAGLGQFVKGTASGAPYNRIFGSGVRTCDCPGSRQSCTDVQAGCAGDPRFDATKSARAISVHLKEDMKRFNGMDDKVRFAIASYNGGGGTISIAVKKTGRSNPTWEQVSGALDRQVIYSAFCSKNPGSAACGYFDTPSEQDAKIKQIRDYVNFVYGYYTMHGGTGAGSFSDQTCSDGSAPVSVKQLGTYSFRPGFTTQIPDLLSQLERVAAFAKETYEQCDGSSPEHTGMCLAQRIAKAKGAGIDIVDCKDLDEDPIARSFERAIADCQDNKQDMCVCSWEPPQRDFTLRVYGTTGHVIVDGKDVSPPPASAPFALFQEDKDAKEEPVALSLSVDGDERTITRWKGTDTGEGADEKPFTQAEKEYEVEQFSFVKRGSSLVWPSDPGSFDLPACGTYKTQYQICARLSEPTYSISEGAALAPAVRFALYLDDKHDPKLVPAAEATSYVAIVHAAFEPSPSQDVSYYDVYCSGTGDLPDGEDASKVTRVLATQSPYEVDIPITKCTGASTSYSVFVVPVDISGRRGQPTVAIAQSELPVADLTATLVRSALEEATAATPPTARAAQNPYPAVSAETVNKNLKQKDFWVIHHTTMPSLLFETFMLVNPDQQRFYESDENARELAEAIGRGVLNYRARHPEVTTAIIENGHGKMDPGAVDPQTKRSETWFTTRFHTYLVQYLRSNGMDVLALNYNGENKGKTFANSEGVASSTAAVQRVHWYTDQANAKATQLGDPRKAVYISVHADSADIGKGRPGPSPPMAYVYGEGATNVQAAQRQGLSKELAVEVLAQALAFHEARYAGASP
jgi:murein DD-endopeptidase MepM/ murein hydrolase activator NlpD/N-acetylmuramoyl-L-alanine amidase